MTSRTRSGDVLLNPTNNSSTTSTVRARPGYHGSLWLDPATGTILRVTIEGELKLGDPFLRADMLVEYGEVEIGGSKFICPVRSLAFSILVNGAQTIVLLQRLEFSPVPRHRVPRSLREGGEAAVTDMVAQRSILLLVFLRLGYKVTGASLYLHAVTIHFHVQAVVDSVRLHAIE